MGRVPCGGVSACVWPPRHVSTSIASDRHGISWVVGRNAASTREVNNQFGLFA